MIYIKRNSQGFESGLGVFLLSMALLVTSASAESPLCSKLADDAKRLVAEANYCKADTDCRWQLYGSPFRCFSLVNKTFSEKPNQLDEIISQRQANKCEITYQDISCNTSRPLAGVIKCKKGTCVDTRKGR